MTQFAYDGEGNQTGVIDPNGRITVRDYDAVDRLIREADPAGGLTEFGYDARNQLIRVIAPNNATTTFEFDLLSRQTAEHSPDRGTIAQQYDRANNLIASTDARGIRREMSYDALNRPLSVTFPGPGEHVAYTYDNCLNGTGRICRIDDESGTLEYDYDGFGNITRTKKPNWALSTLPATNTISRTASPPSSIPPVDGSSTSAIYSAGLPKCGPSSQGRCNRF